MCTSSSTYISFSKSLSISNFGVGNTIKTSHDSPLNLIYYSYYYFLVLTYFFFRRINSEISTTKKRNRLENVLKDRTCSFVKLISSLVVFQEIPLKMFNYHGKNLHGWRLAILQRLIESNGKTDVIDPL